MMLFLFQFLRPHEDKYRACDEYRGVSSHYDADKHRECEACNRLDAGEKQHENHDKRREAGKQRPGKRLVYRVVYYLGVILLALLRIELLPAQVLADAVEHNNGVVERVTYDSKEGRDYRQVNLYLDKP